MASPENQPETAAASRISVAVENEPAAAASQAPASEEITPWLCVKPAYREEFVNWFGVSYYTMARSVVSGLIVSMLQVPESIAFALVAHVPVPSGLWATVFMAIIAGALGGAPGMISGAAGAMASVLQNISDPDGPLSHLSEDDRLAATWATVLIAGVVQVIMGFAGVHKLLRLLGQPVMLGFLNGLALVIFSAQGYALQDMSQPGSPWLSADDPRLWIALAYMLLAVLIMLFLPRLTTAVPGALAALAVVCIIEHGIVRPTTSEEYHSFVVGDKEQLSGAWPTFAWPSAAAWSGDVIGVWFPTAISLAAIGVIESLLTLLAVEQLVVRLSLGSPSGRVAQRGSETKLCGMVGTVRESFAQGLGNIVSGLFGTIGGDAMIGQSMVNVANSNGAPARLSAVVSGIGMAVIILAAAPLVEQLPIPALAGIMVMIVANTFHWNSLRLLLRVPKSDAVAIVLVTVLAPLTNLAIAVVAGVAWLSMAFAWKSGKAFKLEVLEEGEEEVRVGMSGPLFFGSATLFRNAMLPHLQAGRHVTVHSAGPMWDYSGMEQAHTLSQEHAKRSTIKWAGVEMKDAVRAARSGKLLHGIVHEEEHKAKHASSHVTQARRRRWGRLYNALHRSDQRGADQSGPAPDTTPVCTAQAAPEPAAAANSFALEPAAASDAPKTQACLISPGHGSSSDSDSVASEQAAAGAGVEAAAAASEAGEPHDEPKHGAA